jgi:hypothetical protein
MKVNLRVNNPIPTKEGASSTKKAKPKNVKPIYTPAIIASSKIDFAFKDEDGDITVKYAGTDEYYAIQDTGDILDTIEEIIESKPSKTRGFGK